MTYTAVLVFVLGCLQVTLITASTLNTLNSSDYEDHSPTMSFSDLFNSSSSTNSTGTMSSIINATEPENATDTPEIFTTEVVHYSTTRELPNITPPPPDLHSTPDPRKTTTTSKSRRLDIKTTLQPESDGSDSVGIIILIVLIVSGLLVALICYIGRSKRRRYSVDLSSRPDEVHIPLSTAEPNAVEYVTANGLQFEGTEDGKQEPQETHEPEAKLEDQVEQKAEIENVTVDESAIPPTPSADISEEQNKQDVPEQNPGGAAEPSGGEKTGDEEAPSNETSVEPLKDSTEANENNSNSTILPQRGARDGGAFWDLSLDSIA